MGKKFIMMMMGIWVTVFVNFISCDTTDGKLPEEKHPPTMCSYTQSQVDDLVVMTEESIYSPAPSIL